MTKPINPLTLSEYKALVAGIPQYCPTTVFTVAGQTFTAMQAVTFIQTLLTAVAATAAAKGVWKDAIAAEAKLVAQEGQTVKEIRSSIAMMFSNSLNTMTAFEITPRKPYVPLSAAKRAAATAKAAATRLARGTTSKKQKAAIAGNVTGVVITPVTTPAATSTATAGGAASGTGSGVVIAAGGGSAPVAGSLPAAGAATAPAVGGATTLPAGAVTAK